MRPLADDLAAVRARPGPGRPPVALRAAMAWLETHLADGEPRRSGDVYAAASLAGVKPKTLRRASAALGVVKSCGRTSTWSLPVS